MRRYGDALVRMCCLYLNDASLAQDAAQDTFIKAWRNLGQFRGECDERTWLMRIAINTCRDYHRTAWLRHVDRGTPLEALPEAARGGCAPGRRGDPGRDGAAPARAGGRAPALLSGNDDCGGGTGAAHIAKRGEAAAPAREPEATGQVEGVVLRCVMA